MGRTPKKDDKKESAKALYMTGQFTQKQIAGIVKVAPQTLVRWVAAEKWDVILESRTTTKDARIAEYQQYLTELKAGISEREEGKRFPSTAEIDQMAKLESIIKKLNDEANLGELVNFTIDLLNFVRLTDLSKAQELEAICDAYIKSKV